MCSLAEEDTFVLFLFKNKCINIRWTQNKFILYKVLSANFFTQFIYVLWFWKMYESLWYEMSVTHAVYGWSWQVLRSGSKLYLNGILHDTFFDFPSKFPRTIR